MAKLKPVPYHVLIIKKELITKIIQELTFKHELDSFEEYDDCDRKRIAYAMQNLINCLAIELRDNKDLRKDIKEIALLNEIIMDYFKE